MVLVQVVRVAGERASEQNRGVNVRGVTLMSLYDIDASGSIHGHGKQGIDVICVPRLFLVGLPTAQFLISGPQYWFQLRSGGK